MPTTAFDTKTVDGLMAMFYSAAHARGSLQVVEGLHFNEQFTLSAKQFAWLCNVERKEYGATPTGRAGRHVAGQISGVGFFDARERKYGSAIVNIRYS
jgi:hypothetical protein